MAQHFKNDAERTAVLKRSKRSVTGILVIIIITIACTAYKTFNK